jgi:uncharacterized protein YutE (UPF0331/DUF86 family)
MAVDLKTLTEVIKFIQDASELLKKTEGEGTKLYRKALKILRKLGVKI